MTSITQTLRAVLRNSMSYNATAQRATLLAKPVRRPAIALRSFGISSIRAYSDSTSESVAAPEFLDEAERKIFEKLKDRLRPTSLEVQDISGGCGSMYALNVTSEQFKGLSVIKQHRLVNKVLEDEMKQWHGVQLKTHVPE